MANLTPQAPRRGAKTHEPPAKVVSEKVKEEGKKVVSQAKSHAEDVASERKGAAVGFLKGLASAVDSGAEDLRQSGYSQSSGVATKAAREVEEFANTLAERAPRQLLDDLQDIARSRPVVFFGLALAAGFGATRYLKSSAASGKADTDSAYSTEATAEGDL